MLAEREFSRLIVFGAPRSGTSWVNEVLNSHADIRMYYQPLHSYTFTENPSLIRTKQGCDELFQRLLESDDRFINMEIGSGKHTLPVKKTTNAKVVGFKETHFLDEVLSAVRSNKDMKLIYVIRHPIASIDSWYRHPKEFDARDDIRLAWKNGGRRSGKPGALFGFDNWMRIALEIEKLNSEFTERVTVVNYDDLKVDPISHFSSLVSSLDLQWSRDVQDFINELDGTGQKNPDQIGKPIHSQIKLPKTVVEEIGSDSGLRSLMMRVDWLSR